MGLAGQRPIHPERQLGDRDTTKSVLSGLCERVASRARHRGVLAGQVTPKLRYADFHTITRAQTIEPTNVDFEIHHVVLGLYQEARRRELPIRLLGVALAKLRLDAVQLPLFDAGERRGPAVHRVRDRLGSQFRLDRRAPVAPVPNSL